MSWSRRAGACGLDPVGWDWHWRDWESSKWGVRGYEHRACYIQGDVDDGTSVDNSSVAGIRASADSRYACERSSAGVMSCGNADHQPPILVI